MFSGLFKDKRTYMRSKSSFYILVSSLVCFSIMGSVIYRTISADIIKKCKQNVMDMVSVVSSETDGDKLQNITSEEDPEYGELTEQLSKYLTPESVNYIYLMRPAGSGLIFVVDVDPVPEERAPYGEPYELIDDMLPALQGQICCDSEFTQDKWGKYISAYAPVFTSDGSIAGIVGIDTEIAEIDRELRIIKYQIILLISVFFIISLIMFHNFWISNSKHDMLTGILNYDSLVNRGDRLHTKGKLADYTAVQLNIRNFKYINSKIGTSLGDILLIQYADIISGYLEKNEYCARTGSDNFIVLLKNGREDDFVEKLSETWIDLKAYGTEEPIQVSVRCGIYDITDKDSMQDAVNFTSVALKYSRTSNQNYITRFEHSMLESMVSDSSIVTDFQRALSEGEFQVYYQPKVNVGTRNLCGAEALVRWIRDGKVVPPGDFIPVLEAENLITALDFHVFETVCRHICEWEEKGLKPVTVSSNFSKLHLANPNFADSVLMTVKKYGISPELLEVELTESSGYGNYEALTHFVEKMNKANIRTSIDDFGTGYSSLSMLKDINADVVKLDKSFLENKHDDNNHQEKMLANVIKMISDLDRKVICEGVETEKQLELLKSCSCEFVQGYFFDKPLPHDEFEKRLKKPHYDK